MAQRRLVRVVRVKMMVIGRVVRTDSSTSARVAIEVDGHAHHSGRERLSHDRRRQNAIVVDGWTVLRVDWLRMERDRGGFLRDVRAATTAAPPGPSGPSGATG